jgi:hypothetical protein
MALTFRKELVFSKQGDFHQYFYSSPIIPRYLYPQLQVDLVMRHKLRSMN